MSSTEPNGRQTWSVLASWAGVILSLVFGIGGAVGYGFGKALGYIEHRTRGIEDRELARSFQLGQWSERIDSHGTRLIELDTTLQREMRQLDEAMIVRLDELDRRLQGEIARAQAGDTEARAELIAAMREMRAYQDGSRERNAQQDERVRALEREAFKENGP